MATHCNIAYVQQDGTVKSSYVHFDGYLQGVGDYLLNHFNDEQEAKALVDLGSLSSVGTSNAESVAYHRDRGEDWSYNKPKIHADIEEYEKEAGMAYLYLWNGGNWYMYEDDKGSFTSLSSLLQK